MPQKPIPLQYWILSPRMPTDRRVLIACLAVCMFLLTCTPIFVVGIMIFVYAYGPFLPFASLVISLVVSFSLHTFLVWKIWKFRLLGAAEIGIATVFVGQAPFSDADLRPLLMLAGFFAAFRPMTDGPEPGGWGPILAKLDKKPGEKLKGRDEK